MKKYDSNITEIRSSADVQYLVNRITNNELFAQQFKFADRNLFIDILDCIGIEYSDFELRYFSYNESKNIHISESEQGYIWISTYGLVAVNKINNKLVRSCSIQFTVLEILLTRSIELTNDESIYDIDSYNYGMLEELSPAIFQNLIFYVELFCKAYLSVNSIKPAHTHKLNSLYSAVVDTMFEKKHNDTLFHANIVNSLYHIVNHIENIPGNFQEHFVKYNDNEEDYTIIIFQYDLLIEMRKTFQSCNDFIMDFYLNHENSHYLKIGLFERLISKSSDENDKVRISEQFSYLKEKDKYCDGKNKLSKD